MTTELPILRRFPALLRLPRASFGSYPTPVERVSLGVGDAAREILVKRDDLTATPIGGNKVRGLEWLLGDVVQGDRIVTVGPRGSTHALATAVYGSVVGAEVTIVRWNQKMHAAARRVDTLMRGEARVLDALFVPVAYAVAGLLRARRGTRWIPAGGSTTRALLGHVNAALELSEQISRGECETPERVVVPLGTGSTAAGLAQGFRIAALPTRVIAVRVVPRILGGRGRILRLARDVAALINRESGERIPPVHDDDVHVDHSFYGGAYGKPLAQELPGERALESHGVRTDDTYSRKAFAAALRQPASGTLLWLTFDGRLIQD